MESKEASTSRPRYLNSSDEEEINNPDETETAGIRRAGQGMRQHNLGGNVGAWEKHTKGIGAKLLLQVLYFIYLVKAKRLYSKGQLNLNTLFLKVSYYWCHTYRRQDYILEYEPLVASILNLK